MRRQSWGLYTIALAIPASDSHDHELTAGRR